MSSTTSQNPFDRVYFSLDQPGHASGAVVADLLEAAAARLGSIGLIDVHDIVLTVREDESHPRVSASVYYHRIERRRADRRGPGFSERRGTANLVERRSSEFIERRAAGERRSPRPEPQFGPRFAPEFGPRFETDAFVQHGAASA